MRYRELAFEGTRPLPLELHRLERALAGNLGPHGHRFYELLFIERGSGLHRHHGRAQRLNPGDLVFVAPGDVHDPDGLRGTGGWLVLFEAAALGAQTLPLDLRLASFLRAGQAPLVARVPPSHHARWSERLAALASELADERLGFRESARAQLEVLLIEAARLVAPALGRTVARHRPLLDAVFAFIDSRFARPIMLADVARAVGRNGTYLTDLVRRQTGRPIGRWILERRMAEARSLLAQTELTLQQIAQQVGFEDASYFVKRFRAVHRVTPGRFRVESFGIRSAHSRAFAG